MGAGGFEMGFGIGAPWSAKISGTKSIGGNLKSGKGNPVERPQGPGGNVDSEVGEGASGRLNQVLE